MLYGVEAYRSKVESIDDGLVNIILAEGLHETKDLDVLTLSPRAHARLQKTAQGDELFW